MEKVPNDMLLRFLEAAATGISFGGIMLSSEFAVSLCLTVLGFLPTANRWSERWISRDL